MDRETTRIYERHAAEWIAARRPRAVEDGRLDAFARRIRPGGLVLDLGCGPGWYAAHLRENSVRCIAADVALAMLAAAGARTPGLPCLQADAAALPVKARSLDGVWASACYQHLPRHDLPCALAQLHMAMRPGAPLEMSLVQLTEQRATADELLCGEAERRFTKEFPGRLFSLHTPARAAALFEGAGFERIEIDSHQDFWLTVRARRARSLPDLVGPGLRLLICGLNPSLYAADAGVPFARPGNRFWPAARAAGVIARERDPLAAFRHGVGMTDLVKRATVGAAEVRREEYVAGMQRVEAVVRLYQPGATCFVGLEGWRRAVNRRAAPGWIPHGFGGRPAYLMPSTSGRNAAVPLDELAAHLSRAVRPS